MIELGLEERLDGIERPFSALQELPEEIRTSPAGTDMNQVVSQTAEGRTLLILGEPGAGKTTILLKLAQNLIIHFEEDSSQLIPVVFNLPAYVKEWRSFANWLVQELSSKYQVSPAIGKVWVEDQQLLLLLDGLDGMQAERRNAWVYALYEFMQAYGQTEIVICSQIGDYEAISTYLQLQGAICIQSLTLEQINQYLEEAGQQLAAMKTVLQEDNVLQELAQLPLTLSLMSLAYQGSSVEELPRIGSVEERRQHLFNAYINRMFLHEKTGMSRDYKLPYSSAQTIRWLTWLAQRMRQESQTIFLIEQMQPTWLQNQAQKRLYQFGSVLMIGLMFGLVTANPMIGLMFGSFLGLIQQKIITHEALRFSWANIKNGLIDQLIGGLILGLILGLIAGLIGGLIFGLSGKLTDGLMGGLSFLCIGLIGGLSLGLISGLMFGLTNGLSQISKIEKPTPNQGIWESAVNAGIRGLIVGLVIGLSVNLYFRDTTGGLIFGLFFGLALGLGGGDLACIQHFILRLICYGNGFIPWNYARFLDYATERNFLLKVGGGYSFIHRQLLEHFAQLKIEN